jgi:RHS repeat-associated protein
VSIQAYAKYNAPTSTPSNLSGFATALLSAFNLSAPVAGETGTARSAINAWGAGEAAAFGDGSTDNTDPKVFVNIIVFDRNYNFLDISYQQLTSSGVMNASYTTKQPGYVYVYVSNEQQYQTDVYFDDINVTFTPSPVIQQQDYYSFGGDLNKYSRESSVPNKYLYNKGSELHDDQGVQIYLTDLRDYDPWGRLGWWQIDPVADQGQESWTPYHYAYNNPISHNDPKGDCPPGTPCFGLMNLAIADAAAHPNGVGAHTLGVVQGLTNSAEGLVNAVSHPVQTMQGMGNLALAGLAGNPVNAMQMDMALGTNSYGTMMGVTNAVTNGANNLVNGNGMQRGTVLGEIGGAILGTKGINAGFGMMRGALTTASTGRVFWSGGNLAKTAAADFAKATGGKTLEMTFTGKAMNGVSPFLPRSVSGPIWNSLSRSFAKGASGSANFFTTPAGPRAGSIWSTIEKPILDQKKIPITTNVTK